MPTLLTLSRIAVIPMLVALFYLPAQRAPGEPWAWVSWVMVGLYGYACITDFLDGYLARRRDEVSQFGRFLDPIADKLLVAAVLLMMAGKDYITGINLLPAVVILCREILVSGLREFLGEMQQIVNVSTLAKWKTGAQMLALGLLLTNIDWCYALGLLTLWVAAILTLASGYSYWHHGYDYFTRRQQ